MPDSGKASSKGQDDFNVPNFCMWKDSSGKFSNLSRKIGKKTSYIGSMGVKIHRNVSISIPVLQIPRNSKFGAFFQFTIHVSIV